MHSAQKLPLSRQRRRAGPALLPAARRARTCAAAARRCERAANASCVSRDTPYCAATFSDVMPAGRGRREQAHERGRAARAPTQPPSLLGAPPPPKPQP